MWICQSISLQFFFGLSLPIPLILTHMPHKFSEPRMTLVLRLNSKTSFRRFFPTRHLHTQGSGPLTIRQEEGKPSLNSYEDFRQSLIAAGNSKSPNPNSDELQFPVVDGFFPANETVPRSNVPLGQTPSRYG